MNPRKSNGELGAPPSPGDAKEEGRGSVVGSERAASSGGGARRIAPASSASSAVSPSPRDVGGTSPRKGESANGDRGSPGTDAEDVEDSFSLLAAPPPQTPTTKRSATVGAVPSNRADSRLAAKAAAQTGLGRATTVGAVAVSPSSSRQPRTAESRFAAKVAQLNGGGSPTRAGVSNANNSGDDDLMSSAEDSVGMPRTSTTTRATTVGAVPTPSSRPRTADAAAKAATSLGRATTVGAVAVSPSSSRQGPRTAESRFAEKVAQLDGGSPRKKAGSVGAGTKVTPKKEEGEEGGQDGNGDEIVGPPATMRSVTVGAVPSSSDSSSRTAAAKVASTRLGRAATVGAVPSSSPTSRTAQPRTAESRWAEKVAQGGGSPSKKRSPPREGAAGGATDEEQATGNEEALGSSESEGAARPGAVAMNSKADSKRGERWRRKFRRSTQDDSFLSSSSKRASPRKSDGNSSHRGNASPWRGNVSPSRRGNASRWRLKTQQQQGSPSSEQWADEDDGTAAAASEGKAGSYTQRGRRRMMTFRKKKEAEKAANAGGAQQEISPTSTKDSVNNNYSQSTGTQDKFNVTLSSDAWASDVVNAERGMAELPSILGPPQHSQVEESDDEERGLSTSGNSGSRVLYAEIAEVSDSENEDDDGNNASGSRPRGGLSRAPPSHYPILGGINHHDSLEASASFDASMLPGYNNGLEVQSSATNGAVRDHHRQIDADLEDHPWVNGTRMEAFRAELVPDEADKPQNGNGASASTVEAADVRALSPEEVQEEEELKRLRTKGVLGRFTRREKLCFCSVLVCLVAGLGAGLGLGLQTGAVSTAAVENVTVVYVPRPCDLGGPWRKVGEDLTHPNSTSRLTRPTFVSTVSRSFGVSLSLSDDGTVLSVASRFSDGVSVFRRTTTSSSPNTGIDDTTEDATNNGTRYNNTGTSSQSERWIQLGADIVEGPPPEFRRYDDFDRTISSTVLSGDGRRVVAGFPHYTDDDFRWRGLVGVYEWIEEERDSDDYGGGNDDDDGAVDVVGGEWKAMGGAEGFFLGGRSNSNLGHKGTFDVSYNGTVIAIGDPRHDGNTGRVRVFRYDGANDTWSQIGDNINGTNARDRFGWAVSLSSDGTTLAVGTSHANGGEGLVQVFRFTAEEEDSSEGGGWVQVGNTLRGGAQTDSCLLGETLKLSANATRFAVWSSNPLGGGSNVVPCSDWVDSEASDDDRGQVRVYQLVGGEGDDEDEEWVQTGPGFVGDRGGEDFGVDLDLSGDGRTLSIGVSGGDRNGPESGHVVTYHEEQSDDDEDDEQRRGGGGNWTRAGDDDERRRVGGGNNWTRVGDDVNGTAAQLWLGEAVSLSYDGTVLAAGAPTDFLTAQERSEYASGVVTVYSHCL